MAERITTCDKCKSTDIDILDKYEEELSSSTFITLQVEGKCNKCGNIIEFSTWTEEGKRQRRWGHIL